jgi:hypothetical protein
MIIYRVLAAMIWFGIMFAVCTVIIAAALVTVIGAVVVGLASPTRTPASSLRVLVANASAAVVHVRALGH